MGILDRVAPASVTPIVQLLGASRHIDRLAQDDARGILGTT